MTDTTISSATPATVNPLSVQSLGAILNSGTNSVDMVQASPQTALQQQFMQTPAYQLQYGQNYLMDPAQRFENDPGIQMAVQQGMRPLLDNYASKGLSQSGALARALTDYSYGNYNNFTQQQGALFNNYQNQMQQMMNMGVAANSQNATNQNNAYQQLANLLAQANITTGAGLGQAALGTGSNISSLFANQGSLGASAYLNTGAAQANNVMQGMGLAAQLLASAQASRATGGQPVAGGF
jgi:hypothetical protein